MAILNTCIFGFLNGFLTTAYMIMAPEQVEEDERSAAGFI